jgi:hypothetical protein
MRRLALWPGAGYSKDAAGPLGGELLDSKYTEPSTLLNAGFEDAR